MVGKSGWLILHHSVMTLFQDSKICLRTPTPEPVFVLILLIDTLVAFPHPHKPLKEVII